MNPSTISETIPHRGSPMQIVPVIASAISESWKRWLAVKFFIVSPVSVFCFDGLSIAIWQNDARKSERILIAISSKLISELHKEYW